MQSRTFFALALLAGIAGASVAFAQPAGGERGERIAAHLFAKSDANGDGRIDPAEMAASRGARFDKIDRDRDGFVSADELARVQRRIDRAAMAIQGGVAERFDRFDGDGDGQVSRAEFTAPAFGPLAALLDADGDGAISQAEFARLGAATKALR